MGEISQEEDGDYIAFIASQRHLQRRRTVPANLKMGTNQGDNKSIAESFKKVWKDYFSKKGHDKREMKRPEKEREVTLDSPRALLRRMRLRQSVATEEDLLHFAISRDDAKAAKSILDNGHVDVNAMRPPGVSALHQACASGNLQCIQVLLDHGADIETKTWQGQSALHVAARYGNFEAAELLIHNGANMDDIKDGF